MSTGILVVDDDAELSAMLVRLLHDEGWKAYSALTAREGERLLAQHRPAVVLLDVMLTDDNGIEVCRRWRMKHPQLGILMLSARGKAMDKVRGLEVGADDYLAKPFDRCELVARVRTVLRHQQPEPTGRVAFTGLDIDLLRRKVCVDQRPIELTSIEFKLLAVMARNPGQPFARHVLSDATQSGTYRPLDRTVDVQVGRLRRKLQLASPGHEWISTVRGEGYMVIPRLLETPAPASASTTAPLGVPAPPPHESPST